MNVLFVHQNFPGQFLHLAGRLAASPSNLVWALSTATNCVPAGVRSRRYEFLRPASEAPHPLLAEEEAKVRYGEACAAAALGLKDEGFIPDVIIAHSGWGEALFLKDVLPNAKLIVYAEFCYASSGRDVGFDPQDQPLTYLQQYKLRMRNLIAFSALDAADAAITPTEWQKQTFPSWAQPKLRVIHEGVNLERVKRRPDATVRVGGLALQHGDEVLTYVARSLEPVRGFHVFMRTLPLILARRPKAQVLIVGSDRVSYGSEPVSGESWRSVLTAELGNTVDWSRIHFLGNVSYADYLDVLSISRVHYYWTSPFVLSWSFLEAAAIGATIIASSTPPVLEFATRLGINTHAPFDIEAAAALIIGSLARPARPPGPFPMTLSTEYCIAQQMSLINSVTNARDDANCA